MRSYWLGIILLLSLFVIPSGSSQNLENYVTIASTDLWDDEYLDTSIQAGLLSRSATDSYEFTFELAKSLDISTDGLTWVFTLKEGLTFADGDPILASDVKFTYSSILEHLCSPRRRSLHPFGLQNSKCPKISAASS